MASRSLEKAEAAMSEIKSAGVKGELSVVHLDVTDEDSIKKAAVWIEENFGRLDVLMNNAGIASLNQQDVKKQYQFVMDTNVIGPAVVAATLRPLLLMSKNPYSIYVSTGSGSQPRHVVERMKLQPNIKGGGAYVVSKAALNMLAVQEHGQYGPQGLMTFALSPGFVVSNLRGPGEAERSGWGKAGDPEDAGKLALSIIRGERDVDVGCLVHKDGVYPW